MNGDDHDEDEDGDCFFIYRKKDKTLLLASSNTPKDSRIDCRRPYWTDGLSADKFTGGVPW